MDIHELRQFESVYKPSKEVAFCWLRKQYVQLSTEENHTEIVDHANDSLRIWQAAKAQAVPSKLDEINNWAKWHIEDYQISESNEHDRGWYNACCAVVNMLEAQEQNQ